MRASHGPGEVLIVGADSQIGRAVFALLESSGVGVVGTSRRPGSSFLPLDLAGNVEDWASPIGVHSALLCAGVTGLRECEAEPVATALVNVKANLEVARRLVDQGVYVLYISTSQVFDGKAPCRLADDPLSPRTEYGCQRAEVESRLQRMSDGRAGVLRLTKVLTPDFRLLRHWAAALSSGKVIHPFSDMVVSPIPLGFVAGVVTRMLDRQTPGIVQASAHRDVAYSEIAYYLSGRLRARPGLVRPVLSSAAGIPRRFVPAHTSLDTTRLRDELEVHVPDVWTTIDGTLTL